MPWKGHQNARSPLPEPLPTSAWLSTSSTPGWEMHTNTHKWHHLCPSSVSFLSNTETNHGPVVDGFSDRGKHSFLNINVSKTKEIINDFRKKPPMSSGYFHLVTDIICQDAGPIDSRFVLLFYCVNRLWIDCMYCWLCNKLPLGILKMTLPYLIIQQEHLHTGKQKHIQSQLHSCTHTHTYINM